MEQRAPILTMVASRFATRGWVGILLVAAWTRWFALDTLPPGIKYDTSSSGVYALNILFNGARPFYIIPSGAPEPLMVYLQSLAIFLFGPSAFTLHWLSASIGILVVTLLYALARESTRDRRIALVAAFALAIAIEPVNVTRTGLRATLVPLFETAWLLWFWRGWHSGRRRDFVAAGAILGLGMYTYIAALAIALIAAGLWLHQWIFERRLWRARLGPTVVMVLAALILMTPRLIFQVNFPSAAVDRANEVNIFQNPAIRTVGLGGVVAARLLDYVRMFGISWQGELYNVLHQPLLDPWLFTLFLLGIVICLARLRHLEGVWALLVLGVMLLPDLLGASESSPNELRTIGVIPPTYFLVGVGAAAFVDFASRRTWSRAAASIAILLALALSTAVGIKAYWIDLAAAARAGPDEDYNRGEIAEAKWITARGEPVFLPLNEYARSPVHFLTAARAARLESPLDEAGSLDPGSLPQRGWVLMPVDHARPRTEGKAYVHDPAAFALIDGAQVYIMPPAGNDVEQTLLEEAPTELVRDTLGQVVARAYRVDAPARLFQFQAPAAEPAGVQLSQGISLVSGVVDDQAGDPGDTIGISLFWRAARPLRDDYVIFVHLLDSDDNFVVGADVIPALGAYPTYLWRPGEMVATHHQLKIPARAQPGKYQVEVGMYNVLNQARLDVLGRNGAPLDSRIVLGAVKVTGAEVTYAPSHPEKAEFGRAISLLGFDVPANIRAGRPAGITLYWESLADLNEEYTIFVHVLNARGEIVAQADHQPQAGQYPTSIWEAGDQIRDIFSIPLPDALPPGRYRLEIGWYALNTGQRLPLGDGTDRLILDTPLQIGP